jgi:hypothetical protein
MPDGIYGDPKLVAGAYCNGGIMPLVGGELARAAFEHGFEQYGVQQLMRYEELTRKNETYLWYFPDGRHASIETSTSPDASPADAWGSSAILYALMEGVAGVVDEYKLFQNVRLSPRWVAARADEAKVCAAYGASGASFEYSYAHDGGKKTIDVELDGKATVNLHVLLPNGSRPTRVKINGRKTKHAFAQIEGSPYVDASLELKKKAIVQIAYE